MIAIINGAEQVALSYKTAMASTALLASLTLLLAPTLVRVVSSLSDAVFAVLRRWKNSRRCKELARSSQLKISQKHSFTKG